MKAVSVMSVKIKCDSCDFIEDWNPEDWHNKDCPNCGAENIITDSDMEMFKAMTEGLDLVNEIVGDVKEGHMATIKVDSAALKD